MTKDLGDILWWFFTGALTLSTGLLFGFIRYILNEKDTDMKEQTKDMKEMNTKLTEISMQLVILPAIQTEVKKHTDQINDIDKRIIKLEQRGS